MNIEAKQAEFGIKPPIQLGPFSRGRFMQVLGLTTMAVAGAVLGGCEYLDQNSCSAQLKFYGGEIGNLVRNKRDGLVIEGKDAQLAQRIDFQAKVFLSQAKAVLIKALRGAEQVYINPNGSDCYKAEDNP